MTSPATDFDVAKSVSELLEKLDRGRQELVLRWVRESLRLDSVPSPGAPSLGVPIETYIGVGNHPDGRGTPAVDLRSFVEQKRPKSDIQFSAVVAYYYRFVGPASERREVIDASVLQEAFRLAGRTRPPAPYMTLTNTKNQGYLDKQGRGEFRINTVGENLVAMTLPGDAGDGGTSGRDRATAAPRKRKKEFRAKAPGARRAA